VAKSGAWDGGLAWHAVSGARWVSRSNQFHGRNKSLEGALPTCLPTYLHYTIHPAAAFTLNDLHSLTHPHPPNTIPPPHSRLHFSTPAMSLFRDFSFGAASSPLQADHEAERAAMNCSPTSKPAHADPLHFPTSPSRPLTPPPCTMGDLAQILNQHCLTIDTSQSASACQQGPPTPPSDCDDQGPRPAYSRISSSVLRMQRQANSRLQCSSSQASRISNLVRMLEQQDQCNLSSPSSSASTSTSASTCGDDEAISMDYNCPLLVSAPVFQFQQPLWRAADRRDNCVRVTKTVRMRRRSKDKDSSQRRVR
jgi:hypothetical protein